MKHLLELASQRLDVPEGVIKPKSGGKPLSCGELVGGKNFALKLASAATTLR